MNPVLALADDADYFVEPRVAGVVYFKRASGAKTEFVIVKTMAWKMGL